MAGLEKQTDGFLPWLIFQSDWPSFQWNTHAPWPLFQEAHHLYLLLLQVMVAVVIYLVSDKTGLLVTHSGSSFVEFLVGLPLELFPFDMQSFWIWPFLTHLWQVIYDMIDEPLLEPLPFPLRQLLKQTCFKALFMDCSINIVYEFGSEGWYWEFSLLIAGSHRFKSTRSRYSCVDSCTRDS